MSTYLVRNSGFSSSQKRPAMAFIRRFSTRQQPRSQRRQHFRPAGQVSRRTEISDNSASHSHTFNADHGGHTLSWVEVSHELTAEDDKNVLPPCHVDRHAPVASTSKDTAGGVEHPNKKSAMPKSHSPTTDNVEEEERIPPRRVRDKIQRAKTLTIRTISAAIPRFKRRYHTLDGPIVTASTTQLAVPASAQGEPPRPKTARCEVKDPPTVALPPAEDKQPKSADARGTESEEIEHLRRHLAESRAQVAELQKHCEALSRDLEGSHNFLNTADKSSDTDVIRALQRLNAEVQQNATYMADCLAEDFEFQNLTKNATKEQISAVQRASRRIGRVLVESLGRCTPEDVAMLLQIAFQAYLTSVLCQAASSWAFEPAHNKFIKSVYQSLRRVEAQAISGRWRSLTRVHNVHNWLADPKSLVKGTLTEISDILLATGCTTPPSDIIVKITSKFEEKIALLVELIGRLCKMFDEVISFDFEVFIAMPGEKYKYKKMEDADDGQLGVRVEETSVLCTTHIGLTKRAPVGTLWETGKKQKIMVLKAKVLLESFLNPELEG